MTAVLTLLFPLTVLAGPIGTAGVQASFDDLIPLGVRNFDSQEVLKIDFSRKVQTPPSLRLDGLRTVSGIAYAGSSNPPRKKGYIPVILSLLVPGAGEIYMGYYKRGAALVLMEAVAWTGYSAYRSKGLDTRTDYERYADEHWDLDRWLFQHPSGPYATLGDLEEEGANGSWQSNLRGNVSSSFFYMPFISRAEDKQHYYENIGKYNWFVSGWDDWDSALQTDNSFLEYTDNRSTYFSMRVDSNNQLETADRFIYLSIAARAFSLVETILLTRNIDNNDHSDGTGNAHLTITNKNWHSTRITMEYNFK